MKHKHSEVLHAFADGIECEYWCNYNKVWRTFVGLTIFEMDIKVRIKPEPKPKEYYEEDTFDNQYLYIYSDLVNGINFLSPKLVKVTSELSYMGKVRLEK